MYPLHGVVSTVVFVVRRSTRGKRGVTQSDKEADEPEMSAEGDPATTSIQESLAADPIDVDIKPESMKAEIVSAPDALSTEVVSSGTADEHFKIKDDNSIKAEKDVIDTPVADKNTASKGMPEGQVVGISDSPWKPYF